MKGHHVRGDRFRIVSFLNIKKYALHFSSIGLENFYRPGSLILNQFFMKNDERLASWQAVQMVNLICILETSHD